jgi:hypothetical protein
MQLVLVQSCVLKNIAINTSLERLSSLPFISDYFSFYVYIYIIVSRVSVSLILTSRTSWISEKKELLEEQKTTAQQQRKVLEEQISLLELQRKASEDNVDREGIHDRSLVYLLD